MTKTLQRLARLAGALLYTAVLGTGLPAQAQSASPLPSVAKLAEPYVEPVTGWYWNASESGRGFAIERQGDRLFLAGFMYEESGEAVWYTSTLTLQPNGAYAGQLDRFQNGQSLLGTYRVPTSSNVGSATLAFDTDMHAEMQVAPNGKAPSTILLERFPISVPAFQPSNAPFRNGWYWSKNESGRGYFIEVQGSTAFIASFMYKDDGRPTWYTMTATLTQTLALTAPLVQFSQGQPLQGAYREPVQVPGNSGKATFSLSDSGDGVLLLPNGKDVSVEAFDFNGGQPSPRDHAGQCPEDQYWAQGKCVAPGDGLVVAPMGVKLWIGVVPQMGQTYQFRYCVDLANCIPLHTEKFVSYEDLQDEETPEIVAYIYEVEHEFNRMLQWLHKNGKMPPTKVITSVLGNAIVKALADEAPTAVENARQEFERRDIDLPEDLSTPPETARCTPDSGSPRGSGIGPVLMASPPQDCYKGRLYTFGWMDLGEDGTAQGACFMAQKRALNGDLTMYNAQNVSACYCHSGGKVNTIPVKYLCNVFFDAGN